MVALFTASEPFAHNPLHARGPLRTRNEPRAMGLKPKQHADLREANCGEGAQLGSCSRDPANFFAGKNFYASYMSTSDVDPSGRITVSIDRCVSLCNSSPYPDSRDSCRASCEKCRDSLQDWLDREEKRDKSGELQKILNALPDCPCTLRKHCGTTAIMGGGNYVWWQDWVLPEGWIWDFATWPINLNYHPGAAYCIRTHDPSWFPTTPQQQCCYDADQRLITSGPGAGTPDLNSPDHVNGEVVPFDCAHMLDGANRTGGPYTNLVEKYRPPNTGVNCKDNPTPKHPKRPRGSSGGIYAQAIGRPGIQGNSGGAW